MATRISSVCWLAVAAGALAAGGNFLAGCSRNSCGSIFEQTAPQLGAKLELIKNKGEVFIGKQKINELTERTQMMALNLKTCCIVLDGGKLSGDEFLKCKDSVASFERDVERISQSVDEAEQAKQSNQADVVAAKISELDQLLAQARNASDGLRTRVENLQAPATQPRQSERSAVGGQEQEPNNDAFQANVVRTGAAYTGAVTDPEDKDYLKFQLQSSVRDWVEIDLQNKSTTLRPNVAVFDADKNQIHSEYRATSGANLKFSFVANPGSDYYLEVTKFGGEGGQYQLTTKPLKSYDQFEPNDDLASAKPLKTGAAVEGNVMDKADEDWYRVSAVPGAGIKVALENLSDTLTPDIQIRDAQKNQIAHEYRTSGGANVEVVAKSQPGADYIVRVASFGGNAGKYRLKVDSVD